MSIKKIQGIKKLVEASNRVVPLSNAICGRLDAPILVVLDPPPPATYQKSLPVTEANLKMLAGILKDNGFKREDVCIITASPSIPEDMYSSEKKKSEWLARYKQDFEDIVAQTNPKAVLLSGNLAARQYLNKPVKITNVRGTVQTGRGDTPCLCVYSLGYASKFPEHLPTLAADIAALKRLKSAGYSINNMAVDTSLEDGYEYTYDLSDWIENPPKLLAVDTETTGLDWYKAETYPFLLQMTDSEGKAKLVPLCERYAVNGGTPEQLASVKAQAKQILENPNIIKIGHHLKFDIHMLRKIGIELRGWKHDTMQMAYTLDENTRNYSLSDCTKMHVPAMAGYDDDLNRNYDKDKMIEVPPDVMKKYAGGDVDACLRLYKTLLVELRKDARHYKRYTHIAMPALFMFANYVEPTGILIDRTQLEELKVGLNQQVRESRDSLLRRVPAPIRRRAIDRAMGRLSKPKQATFDQGNILGSPDFVREVLFSREGFNLEAKVFTKANNEPSLSTKEHLVYFEEDNEWVADYIEYVKMTKMTSTYVNDFDKYISPADGKIHPSFSMSRTNTGRVASENPNGQNVPKRGAIAKTYRKMFKPTEGYVIIEADYAQVELKIAAVMAGDKKMLHAYRTSGDLHALTAARTMGMTLEQFKLLPKEIQGQKRFEAKAVNFGFIYGMSAKGFKTYAKTQYGIDYTEQQALDFRNTFFSEYSSLTPWHKRQIATAHKNGYIESLHGVKRRLPSLNSKDRAAVSLAERQALNAPVQLLGSDLNLMAAIRFTRDVPYEEARVILTVHDAIILEVVEEKAEYYASVLKWYMENNPVNEWFGFDFPIPLTAEVSIGDNYGSTDEFDTEALLPEFYSRDIDLRQPLQIMNFA